jgi:argininosuccinate lyase
LSDLLRGGRLAATRKDVTAFTSSIAHDGVLFRPVVKINQAHVVMLMEQEIIAQEEGRRLLQALQGIRRLAARPGLEDVHMYVEEEVVKATNDRVGGNLHIAKSRNDQVSTAIRMKLRRDLTRLVATITTLQDALLDTAGHHLNTVFPGYTHLRPAQPITLAHYLVACVDVLERDVQRMKEAYPRVNQCPMGACALATTSFPISRERVAELLGFDGLLENSVDAVGSRDFLLEVLAAVTIFATDVSRMVADLIVWSSLEFGLLELPDAFSATSSIMPQKKNPDVLEVVRARMSRIQGRFASVATSLTSLPSTYNMDLQEITPTLWAALHEAEASTKILAELYPELRVSGRPFEKAGYAFTTATELANILTRKYGVPFRAAHKAVGAVIKALVEHDGTSRDISTGLLEAAVKENADLALQIQQQDIEDALNPTRFVDAHHVRGGPAPREVTRMLKTRRRRLRSSRQWVDRKSADQSDAEERLDRESTAHEAV